MRELERLLRARGYNQTLGVISLDLDGFQEINDLFGPEIGDQLLRAFARGLRLAVPATDWVGRLSSDEFIVLRQLEIRSFGDVISAARELQAAISRQPALLAQLPMNPTVCVGVSSYPEHGSDAEILLQCANTALMEAKRQGRSQLRAYSTAISRQIRDRIELDNDLAQAIDAHQLRLLVQPQVNRDGQLVGGEALLRWVNARGINVPPSQFIPVAEQSGLIFQISEWVLAELAGRIAAWRATGLPLPPLAMNVSARQLESTDRRLLGQLTQVLERHGLEPGQLELEITETALLRNPLQAREQLRLLADQGFRIAIDDFGTGYSSLDLLRTLPVHKLKIDQTFTRMVTAAPEDQAIVRATLTLARGLGMTCIAEGVETEEQRAYLAELGCEQFQGYLCGRPMELDAFTELLQRCANGDCGPQRAEDDSLATTVPLRATATTFEQLRALRDSLDLSHDAQLLLQALYGPTGAVVDFVVLEANIAACRYLRDERENVIGGSLCAMFPSAVTSGLLQHYAACLVSGAPLELDNFTYDNHEVYGETRVYDLRAYPQGDLLSVSWRDVTDRHDATVHLAESAELYRLLAENIVEVILLVGIDEEVRWVSPSLTAMTGWRQGDWVGRRFSDLFCTASGEPQPVQLAAWLHDYGRIRQGRLRLMDPTGSWTWVELSVRRLQADAQRSGDPLPMALGGDGSLREGYVITLETADEKVSSERRLRRMATTDALTGLRNRREVLDWLERRIGDGSCPAQHLALLFCDFDDFKLINDSHGHEAGDGVLKTVAQRLRAAIRDGDLAARIGGDEFLVVLDGVDEAADALAVAEKLRLAAAEPIQLHDLELHATLSVGVALHASGESADLLLRRADRSMYAAKQQGRNRVVAL
jgi:diguanylate cyclase (GGDEF)-like protein/PAS domain S-box-containing protein